MTHGAKFDGNKLITLSDTYILILFNVSHVNKGSCIEQKCGFPEEVGV